MSTTGPSEADLHLDESKLTGDNDDVNLFQWLKRAETALKQLSRDVIIARRPSLEGTFLRIAAGSSPFKVASRPIRNIIARCLVLLYSRGETRTLYDTLQALLKLAGDTRTLDRDSRTCALYCMGELMVVFGPQVLSITMDLVTAALRITRAHANTILLRYHAILSLRKVIAGAVRAIPESVTKDLAKTFRQCLNDKIPAIQRASADALAVLHDQLGLQSAAEAESLVTLCIKGFESADHAARLSLGRLVGNVLSATQNEVVAGAEPPKKSGRRDADSTAEQGGQPGDAARTGMTTLLSLQDSLALLSGPFNRPGTTRKVRIGIVHCYSALLVALGPVYVEANYSILAQHFFVDIIPHSRNQVTRHEILLVRKLIGILLRDVVGVRMLTEQGQIGAIQELTSSYLRKWPALMPGQIAPHPLTLVAVLKELSGLLFQLGHAPPVVQESVPEPLLHLLAHPSRSVRMAAAWCLQRVCTVAPRKLPKITLTLIELLSRDIAAFDLPTIANELRWRALGRSFGLGALFTIYPDRPLYVSYDVGVKVLDMATQLLKRAAGHDLLLANLEVEIAWTVISALMGLGSNFVRPHLPQLLVLWRNALPKLTSKEMNNGFEHSEADLAFLLHLRYCALGAMLQFLRYNAVHLVTLDVARRIVSALSNALSFLNSLSVGRSEEFSEATSPLAGNSLSMSTLEAMLRCRIFQCFTLLDGSALSDSLQTLLLESAIITLTGADIHSRSSVQASIAASSGSFTSIWNVADGYAYGVSSKVADSMEGLFDSKNERGQPDAHFSQDTIVHCLYEQLQKPVIGSCEHDILALFPDTSARPGTYWPEPPPAITSVVDAAVELLAAILPHKGADDVSRTWTRIVTDIRSPRLERNPGRRVAASINGILAVGETLQAALRSGRDTFVDVNVPPLLVELLKEAVLDPDIVMRQAASQTLGQLASVAGAAFVTGQVKYLVDQVVSNRDPYGRAGCAVTFGAIYASIGGLAAGPLLKTIVNMLMSLSNDPHPVVHYWALQSLSSVIGSAGLSYSPHIAATLGMLLKLYMADTHEPEGGTVTVSGLRGDLPAYPVMCRIIDSIVAVLGPELQDSTRMRTLILDLVQEFGCEDDEAVVVEAIQCMQHCLMFVPESLDVPDIVLRLKLHLSSTRTPLKLAAVNSLYLLVQRDALLVSQLGGDALAEALFAMLDADPTVEGVRNIISSWLSQTVANNPAAWIDLCQKIMSQTNASQQSLRVDVSTNGLQDDESESLSVGLEAVGSKGEDSALRKGTARWRTQLFALECLHEICMAVSKSGQPEQMDLYLAKAQGLNVARLLVGRVSDLIKMAFTASTAYVTEIRLAGLVVLRDVIQLFSQSKDPDFQDALLLEQYQAPIGAALTPAFSADSTPEILASAIQVCAIFVGSGVVREVAKMGRILKLLVTALAKCSEREMLSLGDVLELSANASVMLRISTVAAWADLAVASTQHSFLNMVIDPHRSVLSTLWITSLKDFVTARADAEIAAPSTDAVSPLETSFSTLGRDITLPYYEANWSKVLAAVGSFMHAGDPHILAAMHGKAATTITKDSRLVSSGYSEECCIMFPVVFGLTFEVLVSNATDPGNISAQDRIITALLALQGLVRPEYAGTRILDPITFEEMCIVFHRLALVGTPPVLIALLRVVKALVLGQSNRLERDQDFIEGTVLPCGQLGYCARMCACVLRRVMPSLQAFYYEHPTTESITFVTLAFDVFMTVGHLFVHGLRENLRATAIAVYADLLRDESPHNNLIGSLLPSLKVLLAPWSTQRRSGPDVPEVLVYSRIVHGLLSTCLQEIENLSGRHGLNVDMKLKNNLLAAVYIFTLVPPGTLVSRPAVEQYCSILSQKLLDNSSDIANTAAHCTKVLLAAANAGNSVLQGCLISVMPSMVQYIASNAEADDASVQGVDDLFKAFLVLLSGVQKGEVTRALAVVLPCLTLLLEPEGPLRKHSQGLSHLLLLASSWPAPLRVAISRLDTATRDILEASLKQTVSNAALVQHVPKRQIALRQF